MEIIKVEDNKNMIRFKVDTNEESLFYLLKTYLQSQAETDIVGVSREHHLVNETEFYYKVKKGEAKKIFLKALKDIKKDLESKKAK